MSVPSSRRVRLAFAIWTGIICFIVLPWFRPENHVHFEQVQWVPFITPPIRLRDIVLNTLLYLPFGYLQLRGSNGGTIARAVALAAALSAVTECAQLFSHRRFPSTTDLVCNTAGAYFGALWAATRRAS